MLVTDLIGRGAALFTVPDADSRYGSRPATYEDIIGQQRHAEYLPSRFAVYKGLRLRGMSYARIAKTTGKLCHSTIRNGVARAEYTMERDPEYAFKVRYIHLLRNPQAPATPAEVAEYVFGLLGAPWPFVDSRTTVERRATAVAIEVMRELEVPARSIYNAFGMSNGWYHTHRNDYATHWRDQDYLADSALAAARSMFEGGIDE